MAIKRIIHQVLPKRLISLIRGWIFVSTHIHHFLPNCFSLIPIKELFVMLRGKERVPQGSEVFFEKFFQLCKEHVITPHFIDIGANSGWFARLVLRFLPQNNWVISGYEPLKSMWPYLEDLSQSHPNMTYKQVAVGDRLGCTEITEYGSSGLSSIHDIHPDYNGYLMYNTAIINKYSVNMITLDSELDALVKTDEEVVLKIDTQGYELPVLKGAQKWLNSGRIKIILVEVMTLQKYTQSALYQEIFEVLHETGFTLYDMNRGVYEKNGRLSEFDAIFIHHSMDNRIE